MDTPPVRQVDTLIDQTITPVHENTALNEDTNPLIQDVITPPLLVPECELTAVDEGKLINEFIRNDSEDIGMSLEDAGFDHFSGFSGYGDDEDFVEIDR